MKWTREHLQHLKDKGKIAGFTEMKTVKKSKRAKYGNQKVEYDGIVFDSKKEYQYYRELILRQKIGEIGQLQRQVRYTLIEANSEERKCQYVADFVWIESTTGETVICDVKSEITRKMPVYIMKRKLMMHRFNIKILEV